MPDDVPFNRPSAQGNEVVYMAKSAVQGHSSGDGPFTRKCSSVLEQLLDVPRVLLTTSCTHALEMVALLLGIERNDEVIIPSFTFVSTANAFVLHGARIVFADIRPDTLNLDEMQLERLITPRTKAVVPVHYGGVGCEMKTILEIAGNHRVAVIEDNAHGLFAKYQDKYLGTFGSMGTLSFHETKNLSCGEGGALLVNDDAYLERAEIIREKGTNRTRFIRGEIDKYSWVDVGSSYLLADILAAYLYAQLEVWTQIWSKRRRIWEYYNKHLSSWARGNGIGLPHIPAHCEQPYHLFYLIMPSAAHRQRLIAHLKSYGIFSASHYLPLHLSDMGRRLGGKKGDCPVTERVSDCLIRLPFYNDLTELQQAHVVAAIHEFREI